MEQQKLETLRAREDLALQREALAAAAKERQDKMAKGPAEGTRQAWRSRQGQGRWKGQGSYTDAKGRGGQRTGAG